MLLTLTSNLCLTEELQRHKAITYKAAVMTNGINIMRCPKCQHLSWGLGGELA